MIYDNDWWVDVPDAAYLWTKAAQGKCILKANIVSRDMWDWQKGYQYEMAQCLKDAEKALALARSSGLKNLPDPVPGSGMMRSPFAAWVTPPPMNPGGSISRQGQVPSHCG